MDNQYLTGLSVLGESYYPTLQQLRRLFNASLDVICSIDLNGLFQHVSKASIQVWGYRPEELIGRSYMDFIVQEDQDFTRLIEERILRGQPVPHFENRYIRKDGSIVPLAWSAQWDAREKVMFCIARDISGQKAKELQRLQYEREIRQQHEDMQNMLERIDEGFYALDAAFTVTYWNHHAEEILGRRKEDVLGKCLWESFPEIRNTDLHEHYLQALARQVTVRFTTYLAPLTAWYDVNVYPSANGLLVYFRDVSEKKRTEDELHKLSRVAKETNNLVIVTDAQGKTTWVNDAFTKRTGYTLEEMNGQYPGALLRGPETDVHMTRFIEEQTQKGEAFQVEIVNYTKTGEKYWVEIAAQPVYTTDGVLTEFFAIETDITERKRLQEQLAEDMRFRQQQITAAVIKAQEGERSVIGRELHDNVNQVLTTVKLYQELCLSGAPNSAALLRKSMDLLQHTIHEIRCLSRQLSAPTLGSMGLKESVSELVDTIAATNKMTITMETDGIAHLEVEEDLHLALYRILQEHLTNIIKHAEATQVQIILELTGSGALLLRVRDDGQGFDTRQKRSGVGISNMITRAESLAGTLELASRPGRGCTLTVVLPVASREV